MIGHFAFKIALANYIICNVSVKCNYQWRGYKSVLFTSANYAGQEAAGRGKGFK